MPSGIYKRTKIRIYKSGKDSYSYKDGRCSKKYHCKELNCNNNICLQTALYGQGRCGSCATKGKRNPAYGKKFPENSKKMKGNKRSYIHGKGYEPYLPEFNQIRLKIRERDNYTCQNCDITEEEHFKKYNRHIEVHHINCNKNDNRKENLITVCKQCNIQAKKNRNYWKQYFKRIIYAKKSKKNKKAKKR